MRRIAFALALLPLPLFAGDPPDDPPAPPAGPGARFAERDADGDGSLSREEARLPDRAFDALDTDGNGLLEPAEVARMRRGGGGRGDLAGRLLEQADRNGDGLLQREEVPERLPLDFDEADRDGDGALDPDEIRAAVAARGRGAGPGRDGRGGRGRPGPQDLHRRAGEILERLDADGDGKLSAGELPADGRLDLERADRNGDGAIDRFELSLAMAQGGRGPGRRGGGFDPERLAQALREMDADGDGRIARAEWKGRAGIFDRLDADDDGALTEAELRQAIERLRGWPGRAGQAVMRRADADGDGRVSREEWPLAAEAFDRLDRDGDGFLTRDELTPRGPRDRRGGPGEETGRDSAHFLGRFDTDGDGRVTPEEFPHERRFAEMDGNGDGVLDSEEIREALDRRMSESRYGFLERFDLDRDGKVTREEFTGPARAFERHDRNHDGVIDEADGPPHGR